MPAKGTIAFDIIGTCFSLEKLRSKLIALGAPDYALELWFAQTLRDAFALSHAGSYQPLKEVLYAELPRTLKQLEISVNSTQLSEIMATLSELELQPSAKEAFQILSEAGWQIVALTNGSEQSTQQLLEKAGVRDYFAQIFSCDAIQKTKPHPDVYAMVQQNYQGEVWLVAVHAWDIAGAALAGLKTAFVKQTEYLAVYPKPEIVADSLVEVANQIVTADKT